MHCIMKLNYVQISINRTDFVTKHKLSPVNLTWLFQVYGKMFNFIIISKQNEKPTFSNALY